MRPELTQATTLLRSEDPAKLEEALRILQKTVYSFSMKVCGHPEDAEDTMQEVLLKSLPYLAKIESPQALAVWLYKVTRNRCWMSRRRSKFAPKETLALDDLMPDSAELESLSSSPQQTPEAHAISVQESERLHEAVLRIPPSYRLVLVLHDMEGLDTAEVAKIMGLQEGTVRVRLHRARLFVRRELAKPTPAVEFRSRKPRNLENPPIAVKCSPASRSTSTAASMMSHVNGCESIWKIALPALLLSPTFSVPSSAAGNMKPPANRQLPTGFASYSCRNTRGF